DLRNKLTRTVSQMGFGLHDVDRKGEKGFHRIGPGFCTRPDSRAMAAFFIARGDAETAALFRPSSMELVRSLGGDPLTLVSEM
ncbi:MAG: peptidase, partial [Acidobacteria bacterium]|nr:peptidase [Acidobacteriota bacterium]